MYARLKQTGNEELPSEITEVVRSLPIKRKNLLAALQESTYVPIKYYESSDKWEFPFEADGMICIGVRNPHNYITENDSVCEEVAVQTDVRPLRPVNPYIDKIFKYHHGEKTFVVSLMSEPSTGYRPLSPAFGPCAKPPTKSGTISRVA